MVVQAKVWMRPLEGQFELCRGDVWHNEGDRAGMVVTAASSLLDLSLTLMRGHERRKGRRGERGLKGQRRCWRWINRTPHITEDAARSTPGTKTNPVSQKRTFPPETEGTCIRKINSTIFHSENLKQCPCSSLMGLGFFFYLLFVPVSHRLSGV